MPRKMQKGRDKSTKRQQVRPPKRTDHPRRRVRYQVAVSLDGFIAGPNEEFDWIIMDSEIDFKEIYSQFDTMLIGRRTFEFMKRAGDAGGSTEGMQVFIISRTLRPEDHPGVTIVDNLEKLMADLRAKPGKDIWLMGGGSLFRSFAELGMVDTVEVAVIPVLLGEGVPLFPGPSKRVSLRLTGHRLYAKTGIMSLEYAVQRGDESKRRR